MIIGLQFLSVPSCYLVPLSLITAHLQQVSRALLVKQREQINAAFRKQNNLWTNVEMLGGAG